MEILIVIVFGLPGALLALFAALYGAIKKNYKYLIASAVMLVPSSYYLSGGPGSPFFIRFIPLLALGAAWAVYKGKTVWAWLFLTLPLFSLLYFLFLFVYVQAVEG